MRQERDYYVLVPDPSQGARLELALLDPQVTGELGIVASNLLHETLCILTAMNVSMASPSGLVGQSESSTTA